MALGIGFERAGWRGLGIAALAFIGPAAFIMLGLAVLYVDVGSLSEVRWLLYGMSPVVVAVIAHALLTLAPTAFTDAVTWCVGIAAFALSFLILQPLVVLIGGALVVLAVRNARRGASPPRHDPRACPPAAEMGPAGRPELGRAPLRRPRPQPLRGPRPQPVRSASAPCS